MFKKYSELRKIGEKAIVLSIFLSKLPLNRKILTYIVPSARRGFF